MVYEKVVKSKVLAVFLAVVAFFCVSLRVEAVEVGGIDWNTNSVKCSKVFEFVDVPSDGESFGYTSKEYVRPVDGVFYFNFYAPESIFKYDAVNLNYRFDLLPITSSTSSTLQNITTECSLIHAGIEYPLPALSGWLNKLSLYGTNTYMTIKVKFSADLHYRTSFITSQIEDNVAVTSAQTVGFSLSLVTFDQYEVTDSLSDLSASVQVIDDKIDALSEDGAGVQGAINNQTTVIQQGNQLQEQQNALQEEANYLQEEQNKLQEEQNNQEKNFFDNFFSNLGNTVKSWIIPSSEQLTAFLDEVNTWFGDRLGFVWYPFDLAYDMVSALAKGDANTKLKIPPLTLNMLGGKYTIWNAMEVDMDAFGIFQYVRFFTSVLVVGGVVRLAIVKWDSWIGGRHG